MKKICTSCDEEYYDGKRIGNFLMQNTHRMNFCMQCGGKLKEADRDAG